MKIKQIIWDWNGTLLNDVKFAVDMMNIVLKRYSLPQISVEKYRELFCFPVKRYYEKVGFDFNKFSFKKVGMEFIDLYNEKINQCKLHENAEATIKQIKNCNVSQIIISARYQESLLTDLQNVNISEYFDLILGIDNNYANGKQYLFEKYLSEKKINPRHILLIGDTTHDCEIAQNLGMNFLLFEKGHQAKSHFAECKDLKIIGELTDILKIIL